MIDPKLTEVLRVPGTARYRVSVAARYQDVDANGHVNHGVFPAYIEEARLAMRRDLLGTGESDRGWVIAGLAILYLAPVRYPAVLDVGVSLLHVGRTSFQLGYGLFTGQTCAAIAQTRSVYVDRTSGASVPLPADLGERMSRLIGPTLST